MTILNISQSVNTFAVLGMKNIKFLIVLTAMATLVSLVFAGQSYACVNNQQACSSTYGVSRPDFSGGSVTDTTCSTSYCAAQTLGDTTAGLTSGTSYQAQTGYNVDRNPSLEFYVNSANINAGVLSTSSTATATATFSVLSYLSSGYSVITVSPPPQNGSYTMAAPSTPTVSSAGSEQFGINLVGNDISSGQVLSTCATINFGSNPVQVPSSSFSYGAAAANYNTCGKFMYKNGDTIASSSKSSGQTDYTISYIFNISNLTPGGEYTMNQQLVAIPTF